MPYHFHIDSIAVKGWALLVLITCPTNAVAHQFEDGYVERTVAVRIRDRSGTIEYSIGLNDATMAKFGEQWPDDVALFEQFRQSQMDGVSDPHQTRRDTDPANHDTRIGGTSINSPPIDGIQNGPEDGALINEVKLIRAFAKTATPHLQLGIRVLANEQPLKLELVSSSPSPRHHATLQTVWKFELPQESIVRLSVQDANFLRQPGGTKYALKTSGASMTLQSNVAPILIRASRINLDGLGVAQRLKAPGIEAKIKFFQAFDLPK